ncbi:roadblock/LC7 domain-containing protein [Frankia sp. CNm7]|uniref:Roadblock/LC7 domain-containing protein n=1 Tax=Frankia nepalensis TaxID=1836974 RepID=A0A937R6Y8_9ACTN|nr:roadblock/LC7 domain-containing protein [Frankia nepalensis]MBL7499697.1 roadblock/LC7 domain-containing protein [Frankia nepalensis]MBL7513244.1 roadblock/LC7 domain-containing protein [Frankia nepalensis]MBL7517782.1 roadblock/LC7 domain-containing protein [Frankia nepalensis]MBL7626436.1 roadblock/LC7 domain-containing protein [Frankia nepalensis]
MITDSVLEELTTLRERVAGVTNSAVASVDGLLIAHDTDDVRPEVLAAMAAVALGLGKSTGTEVGMGELREVITRCAGGHIVVYAVRERSLLVVLGDEGLDLNRLHLHSRPAVNRLGELLAA